MGQLVQVQSGQAQVQIAEQSYTALDKVLVSDDKFDRFPVGAFTSLLTDLGPSIFATAPILLTGASEANKVMATFTPTFRGYIRAAAALVTTAASTAAKLASFNIYVDTDTGVNQVNSLTTTGVPTGGTLTVTVNGQTTTGIAFGAAAAAVQAALEALSNVAVGDVVCAGGALPAAVSITFGGSLAGQVVTISASGAGLTGGTTPAAVMAQTTAGSGGTAGILGTGGIAGLAPTQLNGGVINLTSANTTPAGTILSATNIIPMDNSGPNSNQFMSGSIITVRTSAVVPTTFIEGAVVFMLFLEPTIFGTGLSRRFY